MSIDIVGQVVDKMKQAGQFALQFGEMTAVSGEARLLTFVLLKTDINEHGVKDNNLTLTETV